MAKNVTGGGAYVVFSDYSLTYVRGSQRPLKWISLPLL